MSRKFRPVSQSGMYSVRGSEIARSGNSNPNRIRCVVELQDDSEFIIDLDVSNKFHLEYITRKFKLFSGHWRDLFGCQVLARSRDRSNILTHQTNPIIVTLHFCCMFL